MRDVSRHSLIIGAVVFFAAVSGGDKVVAEVKDLKWFERKEFTSLKISKFKSISDSKVEKEFEIKDAKVISAVVEMINNIPAKGDEMESFGPKASQIDLDFGTARGAHETIQIFQNRFKTPSTAFNSMPDESERVLSEGLRGLLDPDLEKVILKIEGARIQFKEFSVTYIGSNSPETQEDTASVTRNHFAVVDKKGNAQELVVSSGQLSPRPLDFKVGNVNYSLLTYRSMKGERLFPHFFQITNKRKNR